MLTTANKVREQLNLNKQNKLEDDLAMIEAKIQSVMLELNQTLFVINMKSVSEDLLKAIANAGYNVEHEGNDDYTTNITVSLPAEDMPVSTTMQIDVSRLRNALANAWDNGRDYGNLEATGPIANDKPMPHRNAVVANLIVDVS